MFIRLDIVIGPLEKEAPRPMLINFDYVAKISPGDATTGKKLTKLTMHSGETLAIVQSLDFIQGTLDGTLEQGYVAPEPKDP